MPRLSITDQPWIIATAITFFFHPFYLFYSKVSEKKNCSELFFFHESIRDCRGNEDDSSIVSIPFLWNIIIFRKHSKLGNIFRESFTETIIIFARYGHRQPQVLGNLYEVSQNSPGTSIHGHLSNIGSIPLGSKGITHLSIGVNIDPPLIGTIFDRKPRSSFAIEKSPYASTIRNLSRRSSLCLTSRRRGTSIEVSALSRRRANCLRCNISLTENSEFPCNSDREWTILFFFNEWSSRSCEIKRIKEDGYNREESRNEHSDY